MAEGQAWVNIGAKTDDYERGLNRAKKKTSGFGSAIKKIGGAMAAAFAVKQVGQYVNKVIQAGAETSRMADRLGIGVEALGELNYAAKQFGVNSDAMRDGLKELTMRVDEFAQTGSGPAAEVMDRLGISRAQAQQLKGNTEMLFNTMVSKISQVQNTASKQRIADELFGGTGGEQLVEMVSSGTQSLEKFRQEAQNVGAVMSEKTAKSMEKFDRQMTKAKAALQGVGRRLVSMLVPVLQKMMKLWPPIKQGIVDVINYFVELYNKSVAFRAIVQGIKFAFQTVWEAIKLGARNILQIFQSLGDVIKYVFTGQWGKIKGAVKEGLNTIGQNFADFGKNTADNFRNALENTMKMEKVELIDTEQAKEQARDAGNQAGKAYASGFRSGASGRSATIETKADTKGFQPIDTEKVSGALASMDDILAKNNELQKSFQKTGQQGIMQSNLVQNAFSGMANVITESMNSSKNVFQGFWEFFKSFVKGLIAKLIAAAIAAAVLAAVMMMIPGMGIGGGVSGAFGGEFMKAFGMLSGLPGMARGGKVTKGGNILVGERGPEILNVDAGSSIHPIGTGGGMGGGQETLVLNARGSEMQFILDRTNEIKRRTQ